MAPTDSAILSMGLLKRTVFGGTSKPEYHFCVSVENGEKRVKIEKVRGATGVSVEWGWKALEGCGWDVERAVEWVVDLKIVK
jgi:hypothetical protein